MVSTTDKFIYFPKSFNEQMAWIGEEVEHIIKYNDEHDIKRIYKKKAEEHMVNRDIHM